MKEVITLQFGEQANYAGTHYWNLMQAAMSEDAGASLVPETLYCEQNAQLDGAPTCKTQSLAPRLLVYDKAGNYASWEDNGGNDGNGNGNDSSHGSGGDKAAQSAEATWNGQEIEVHAQQQQQRRRRSTSSPGTDESTIRYWTDFSDLRYHPRTLNSVSGLEFGSSLGEMNTFIEGQRVFEGEDSRDEVLEGRFREFAEECDLIQGFQVLADACGGFAGYASAYLQRVREEYPKSPIVLYNVCADRADGVGAARQTDIAVAVATALGQEVSMSVPLFAPSGMGRPGLGVDLDLGSQFQTSAFAAAHTAQWSYSLLARTKTMDDVVDQVTRQGCYRIAESLLAPGLEIGGGGSMAERRSVSELVRSRFIVCSSARVDSIESLAGQLFVDRGTAVTRLVADMLPRSAYIDNGRAVALPRAFPPIFGGPKRTEPGRLASVGVAGLLCSTSGSEAGLQRLHGALKPEQSKYLKDYERDDIRELRYALDSCIDRYSSI
ncbi:mtDNA inheritance, partitioning of the mitochondrial organelle [Coemansia sp. RSA 2599]|nr:mtDNA inheritance, partitioning of the mitochondrial organelle [Coemansia sp. RSA 2599]